MYMRVWQCHWKAYYGSNTLIVLFYLNTLYSLPQNKPVVNWDPQTAEIMKLKATVQQLTMKLIHAGLGDMSDE